MRTHTHPRRILCAAVVIAGGLLATTAKASAAPSCVAQAARDLTPGTAGPAISDYARTYPPLGAIISFEATSPKDDCPPE
jgi:hypothetical protein